MSASSALAAILRDIDASPVAGLPSALSVLRRRTLIASADRTALDAWSSRLLAALRGPVPEARCAAAALLGETVRQCAEPDFSRHREVWTAALLHLLQPVGEGAASEAAVAAATSVRLAAAETLAQMATTVAAWPAERREFSGAISRLASALVSMLGASATQQGSLLVLSRLLRAAPHSLRAHREKLGELLPAVVLDASASSARGAAALLGALPSCLPAATTEEAWLVTVQRLVGTMHSALGLVLGSVSSRPPVRYALPAYALPADTQQLVAAPPSAGSAAATAAGSGGGSGAAAAAALRRRTALVQVVTRCALALHCCLCPPTPPSDAAAALPVPIDLLLMTATHVLGVDGTLPLRTPSADALPPADVLLVLPDAHIAAMQLLHSTLSCAKRHCLGHVRPRRLERGPLLSAPSDCTFAYFLGLCGRSAAGAPLGDAISIRRCNLH